jgi:hypothetical protein
MQIDGQLKMHAVTHVENPKFPLQQTVASQDVMQALEN